MTQLKETIARLRDKRDRAINYKAISLDIAIDDIENILEYVDTLEINALRAADRGDGSALWLIEKLWADSLENDIDSARGYAPEGYALTESDADALVAQAGLYTGKCWAISSPTPMRRKRPIPLLPNHFSATKPIT